MSDLGDRPTWMERRRARFWWLHWVTIAFGVLIALMSVVTGFAALAADGRFAWPVLVTVLLCVAFIVYGYRGLKRRRQILEWDSQHPGEAPDGPTVAECASMARNGRRFAIATGVFGILTVIASRTIADDEPQSLVWGILVIVCSVVVFWGVQKQAKRSDQ
jgi:hypothetical protein